MEAEEESETVPLTGRDLQEPCGEEPCGDVEAPRWQPGRPGLERRQQATKVVVVLGLASGVLVLVALGFRNVVLPRVSVALGRPKLEELLEAANFSESVVVDPTVKNWGVDCWMVCQGSGHCPGFCGEGSACCRFGSSEDPAECYGITQWGSTYHHTCVKMVTPIEVFHQGQDCWDHCQGSPGYCSWCGRGSACCRMGSTTDPLECHGVTFWPASSWHTCVAPNLRSPGQILPPGPTLAPCPPGEVMGTNGTNAACVPAPGPMTMTFYMYAAHNWDNYHMENTNLASLTGALWFLQDQIVTSCPRKYGLTRLVRYLITMKNTEALWTGPQHSQFGQYVQFIDGACASAINGTPCDNLFTTTGHVVGCTPLDTLGPNVPNYAGPPAPVWYSLPGRCPSMRFPNKTEECMRAAPGGECSSPDGTANCTWTAKPAGEILLNDLSGIFDYWAFCRDGGVEYDKATDKGIGTYFWNDLRSDTACRQRVARVQQLFQLKYPDYPATLGAPPCTQYR